MRRKKTIRLGLAAAGLLIAGAGVAQDRGEAPEQDESRARATSANPVAAERPVARPGSSQPSGAAPGTSPGAAGAAAERAEAPPAGALKRIDTKPLSANANIALPQDI